MKEGPSSTAKRLVKVFLDDVVGIAMSKSMLRFILMSALMGRLFFELRARHQAGLLAELGSMLAPVLGLMLAIGLTVAMWTVLDWWFPDFGKERINKLKSKEARRPLSAQQQMTPQPPPQLAIYLIYLLIPKKQRESLGDLEEEYYDIYHQFGRRRARFWYWWQVGASLAPFIRQVFGTLLRWGVVVRIGEAIGRLFT